MFEKLLTFFNLSYNKYEVLKLLKQYKVNLLKKLFYNNVRVCLFLNIKTRSFKLIYSQQLSIISERQNLKLKVVGWWLIPCTTGE